jgi:D-alanyl-D-alanine dipeptidase
MYARGADTLRHFIVTAGDNARHAHPFPSAEKILEPGDIIRIDFGGLFAGHGTDIARMGIVGQATEDQARRYKILRDTQREIATRFVPGIPAREVFRKAVEGYASRGVSGYSRDHVGHSLSILGGHDNPMLHPGNETLLEENMVFALEPIFPDPDGRRYTLEDIFVVTPEGGRMLTTATDTTEMFRVR